MHTQHDIEVWYLKSPVHMWTLDSHGYTSVEEAKQSIQELKKLTPWDEYAYRVVTVKRTYTIHHSE